MITGTLTHILEAQEGEGQKGHWIKQPFVIKEEGQYGKDVSFLAWTKHAETIQSLPIGTTLTVSYKPESREYNGRWYTDLRVTDVVVSGAVATPHVASTTEDDSMGLPF
jgi:hypothetical protein